MPTQNLQGYSGNTILSALDFPAVELGEVGEERRDGPFKSFRLQGDPSDGPISIAGDAFPLAAVRAVITPRRGEATITRQPGKELEEVALLLLGACSGGRG